MLLLPPLLVFSARPQSHILHRIGRLILAAALFHLLLHATLNIMYINDWNVIEAFRDQVGPHCHVNRCEGEPKPRIRGINLVFAYAFGWVAGLAYTGFWEYLWKKIYKSSPIPNKHGKLYNVVSKITIYAFYVGFGYIMLIAIITLPFRAFG